MLRFEDAKNQLLQNAQAIQDTEVITLTDAVNRVLAEPIVSQCHVPPYDNSAMDGYALQAACQTDAMPVSQRITAGETGQPLIAGSVARIFTGAPIPLGADSVIAQEQAQILPDGKIHFNQTAMIGQNIRRQGEDIRQGQTILPKGRRLSAADIGLVASIGVPMLTVLRRLRVTVFFTGNELVEPGKVLQEGQIYDSNRYWLVASLKNAGYEVTDLGVIQDNLAITRQTLKQAAQHADVIISCGGVSSGEEDYVKAALEQEGSLHLWKIAIKPGKPLAYGTLGQADFIGLPGNPVSGFVTYQLLARPFLQRKAGLPTTGIIPYNTYPASFSWEKADQHRTEFLRVRRVWGENGWQLQRYPQQGSGILMSCAWAEGVVQLPPGKTIAPGDLLEFLEWE